MMNTAHDAVTFAPEPTVNAEVVDFAEALRLRGMDVPEAKARLVSKDGRESIELPDELFRVLKFAAESLANNQAVTVAPVDKQLTTQEAADFLGISRPTLVKIIDGGELDCTKVGRHRRVRLADLLAYQRRLADERDAALTEMVRVAEKGNLYESTANTARGVR